MCLDRSIKMWREDLVNGLISIDELYEDFGDSSYGKKLVDSVLSSLNFTRYKNDEGYIILTILNLIRKHDAFINAKVTTKK